MTYLSLLHTFFVSLLFPAVFLFIYLFFSKLFLSPFFFGARNFVSLSLSLATPRVTIVAQDSNSDVVQGSDPGLCDYCS